MESGQGSSDTGGFTRPGPGFVTLGDRIPSNRMRPYACAVWHEERFRLTPAYRAAAVESYKAETRSADFRRKPEEARREINDWVSEAINGLITSILPERSVDYTTTLVLANAIYFKGMWSKAFATEDTKEKKFYRIDGSHVEAPFMHSHKDQFVREHDGFKVLKLPYRMRYRREGPRFSMHLFLPDARDGLPIENIASNPSFLQDHLPKKRVEIGEFRLPNFKLCFFARMVDVLKDMGIEAVFNEMKAEFSDMLEGEAPVLQHVFHKAVIEVNQEGTEAAASTACKMARKCALRICKRVNFIADHPFAFFLLEEVSGVIVFTGQVLDPTESA